MSYTMEIERSGINAEISKLRTEIMTIDREIDRVYSEFTCECDRANKKRLNVELSRLGNQRFHTSERISALRDSKNAIRKKMVTDMEELVI